MALCADPVRRVATRLRRFPVSGPDHITPAEAICRSARPGGFSPGAFSHQPVPYLVRGASLGSLAYASAAFFWVTMTGVRR
jgi:hypothetical protein